ncbi:MAG: ABC transporter permease, partial [Acidimicrobiia bacterium]
MEFLAEVAAFLSDPESWSGSGGIPRRMGEHTYLSLISVAAAAFVALPPAVWLGHRGRGTVAAVATVNIGRAVPSFGILAIGLVITIEVGLGLGAWPTFIALFALAAPPIFTNAITGVQGVDPGVVEAARGMGFTESQLLRRVELPLGLPLILEGLRVALLQVIATATLA